MSSGQWAGRAAADYARALGPATKRRILRSGGATLADGGDRPLASEDIVWAVQAEVFPFQRNYFRSAEGLEAGLTALDAHWQQVRRAGPAALGDALKAREAVAMLATARWMYRSALARTETRGMHRRTDHTETDPRQRHSIASGGLDEVWARALPPVRRPDLALAA